MSSRSRRNLAVLEVAAHEVERLGPGATNNGIDRALVHKLLVHAEAYPWTMQDIGLMGLRLDDHWEYRLHVWDPSRCEGEPVIHDHPFDFVSQIVTGQMTNTRYVEDPAGIEYRRIRYSPDDESARRAFGTVRLTGTSTGHRPGDEYVQLAHELHDSRQLPGTVTIIRRMFRDVPVLTVCTRDEGPWVSGQSRPATPAEIKEFAANALAWF